MPTARLKSAAARAGISAGGVVEDVAPGPVELPGAPEGALPLLCVADEDPAAPFAGGTVAGCVGLGASENSEHADRNVVRAATHATALSA